MAESGPIFMRCHYCDDVFRGTQGEAFNLGWRMWAVKMRARYLCPKHAEQKVQRYLRLRAKRRNADG